MNQSDKALELFNNGYSCAQAILISFANKAGIDYKTSFRIGSGLGGGIGRTQNICGAINAGAILLGLKYGCYPAENIEAKDRLGILVREFVNECNKALGATQCLEITKVDLNNEELKQFAKEKGYLDKVCNKAVADTASILEKFLKQGI